MGKKMSKDGEELAKILDNLGNFADRTDSHVLALVLHRVSDEEADELPVAGDEIHCLIKGDVSYLLDNIRQGFRKDFKKLKERSIAMAMDMAKRKANK